MMPDDDVKRILEPHRVAFTQSWRGAFTDYRTKYTDTRPIHSKLARAILLRDHCIDHVRRNFVGKLGVEIKEQGNLFLVILSGKQVGIDDSIACRLKKFNEKMLTSNIPTRQAKAFDEQKPVIKPLFGEQFALFGEAIVTIKREPIHVNVGYQPDNVWMDVEGVYATMPDGRRSIKWFLKISDDDSGEAAIINMPIESSPQGGARDARVRARNRSSS